MGGLSSHHSHIRGLLVPRDGLRHIHERVGFSFVYPMVMSVVIFLEQCQKESKHWTALIGIAVTVALHL